LDHAALEAMRINEGWPVDTLVSTYFNPDLEDANFELMELQVYLGAQLGYQVLNSSLINPNLVSSFPDCAPKSCGSLTDLSNYQNQGLLLSGIDFISDT
jgi:hypothetical protein